MNTPAPTQKPATDLRTLTSHAIWALRLGWTTHSRLTGLFLANTLMSSAIPAGLALVMRDLINLIAAALGGERVPQGTLARYVLLGFALTLAELVSVLADKYLLERLREALNLRINTAIMEQTVQLPLALLEEPGLRDMLHRAYDNISAHVLAFLDSLSAIAHSLIQAGALLLLLTLIDPLIALILGVLLPPYALFMWRLAKERYATEYTRARRRRWTNYYVSRLTQQETAPEVRLLDLSGYLIARFRDVMAVFMRENKRFDWRRLWGGIAFVTLASAGFYMVLMRVIDRTLRGSAQIGDLAIFGGAAARLAKVAETLAESSGTAVERALFVSNLRAFLDLRPPHFEAGYAAPDKIEGRIELEDVWFTYPGAARPTIQGVSLTIEPGEIVALVGENGAGKTTLAKLMARIYEPDRGRVLFGGCDAREFAPDALYRHISFVFQTVGRYESSAAENIAYGNLAELLDQPARIEALARFAMIDEMIRQMPRGYATRLGKEFGEYDASGGQWQMIAIARALARDAALLILDEPSAHLDARAEHELLSRFKQLARGRTTLVISHRFSTVSMANRIIVLDKGRIVEEGSHHDLIAQNGPYAQLYRLHQRTL